MIKSFALSIFILLSLSGFSQSYGYFGKKNSFSLSGIGFIPLYYNYTRPEFVTYKTDGDRLKNNNDLFEGGINLSISHSFGGKFAIGFEYNHSFYNIKSRFNLFTVPYEDNYYDFSLKHEQLTLRTSMIMPKVEFSFNSRLLPIGINHQIGVGLSSSNIVKKDYLKEYNPIESDQNEVDNSIVDPQNFINYSALQKIKGITIMYAFNIRQPIAKHFALNYGLRYTLNLKLQTAHGTDVYYVSESGIETKKRYYISSDRTIEEVRAKQIYSILAPQFGINYIF